MSNRKVKGIQIEHTQDGLKKANFSLDSQIFIDDSSKISQRFASQ